MRINLYTNFKNKNLYIVLTSLFFIFVGISQIAPIPNLVKTANADCASEPWLYPECLTPQEICGPWLNKEKTMDVPKAWCDDNNYGYNPCKTKDEFGECFPGIDGYVICHNYTEPEKYLCKPGYDWLNHPFSGEGACVTDNNIKKSFCGSDTPDGVKVWGRTTCYIDTNNNAFNLCYGGTCTPKTCSSLGVQCGTFSNQCGGTLNCGSCSNGLVCTNGQCTTPPTDLRVMARATDGTALNVDVGTCRGGGTTEFIKTGDETDSCDVELKPRDVKTSVGKTEYEFKRWKIGKAIQTSGEESINVDLTSDKTVLAVFEKIGARALEVKAQLADGTPISPGVSVTTCWGTDTTDFIQRGDPIETCSVDLKESDKVSGIYDFERWIIGGSQRGVGADSVSFGLLNNDKTAVALYAPRTVDLTVRARNEAGNLLSRGVQVKTCFNSTEYKRTDFTVSGNATNSCKVNLKDGEKSFDNGNYLFKNWKMGGFSYPDGDDPIFPSLFSDRIVTAIYTGEDPPAPLSVTLTPIDEDRDGRFEVGEKIFLEADVSGTAKGTINYTFYCNKPAAWTDVREGWIHKKDGTNDDPYKTPSGESCVFNSVGDKSPKVIVERGTAPNAEDREPITIVESNNPPELEVNIWVQGHKTQDTVKLNKGASSTVEWAVEKGITQECEIRKIILDGDSTHVSSEQSGTDTINSISSFISYTMYCSANDGELEDSDTVNINVKIEPPCSVTIDAENKGNGCWDVNGIVSGATRCSGGAVPTVEGVENWLAESFTEGSNTVENICPEQTTNLTLGCNECTGAPLTLIPLNDTKYVCNTSTYSCSAVDGGTSSDYSTMEACDANCNPSPCIGDDCTGTPKYKCTSNGSCSTSGGSGKAYTSQLRCDVNCDTTPQSGYICNTERKACEWSASGGSGFLSCLESCGVPKKPEVCDPSFQVCDYSKLLRSFIEEINPGETSFNIFNFFRDMLPGFIVKTYAR